jgi:formylglycine-generating enzyme required for sulfatase activity
MSAPNPHESALVLGGQNPPPIDGAILGGLAGIEQTRKRLFDRFGEIYHPFRFETVKVDDNGEIIDREQKQSYFFTEQLNNDVLLEMVYIPAGSFVMGSEEYYNEQPPHLVDISEFQMGKYPITQRQYQAVMNINPSFFQEDDLLPVENVSWNNAQKFCETISHKTGKKYRLPSESEWEYACRARSATLFSCGNTITDRLANFSDGYIYREDSRDLYKRKTTPVGSYPANEIGLYDLHGNIWEWCQDRWHNNYQESPPDRRIWETGDSSNCRVLRGGSWLSDTWFCRSANRSYLSPESKNNSVSFRVVLSNDILLSW